MKYILLSLLVMMGCGQGEVRDDGTHLPRHVETFIDSKYNVLCYRYLGNGISCVKLGDKK